MSCSSRCATQMDPAGSPPETMPRHAVDRPLSNPARGGGAVGDVLAPNAIERRQVLMAAGLGACMASASVRAQAAPTAAPAEVRLGLGAAPRLQGSARLRLFGLSIYTARLWVSAGFEPQRFEAHPLALELIYARSLKGLSIAERSMEEMRRGGPLEAAEAPRWLAFMTQAFPNVAEGDRLTGIWSPSDGLSSFHFNGGSPKSLRDPAFGPRFFGIWLASHTSEPSLRPQLLGLGS